MKPATYESRFREVAAEVEAKAQEAQAHVAALLGGTVAARVSSDPMERIAVALERIAHALEK